MHMCWHHICQVSCWSSVQASKSLAKRKREEAEAEAGQREHRRLRLEMRRRGHVVRQASKKFIIPAYQYSTHSCRCLKDKPSQMSGSVCNPAQQAQETAASNRTGNDINQNLFCTVQEGGGRNDGHKGCLL